MFLFLFSVDETKGKAESGDFCPPTRDAVEWVWAETLNTEWQKKKMSSCSWESRTTMLVFFSLLSNGSADSGIRKRWDLYPSLFDRVTNRKHLRLQMPLSWLSVEGTTVRCKIRLPSELLLVIILMDPKLINCKVKTTQQSERYTPLRDIWTRESCRNDSGIRTGASWWLIPLIFFVETGTGQLQGQNNTAASETLSYPRNLDPRQLSKRWWHKQWPVRYFSNVIRCS